MLFNPNADAFADLSGWDYVKKHIRPHDFKTGSKRLQFAINMKWTSEPFEPMTLKLLEYLFENHAKNEAEFANPYNIMYCWYGSPSCYERTLTQNESYALYST